MVNAALTMFGRSFSRLRRHQMAVAGAMQNSFGRPVDSPDALA
jgi:hypothetical protein